VLAGGFPRGENWPLSAAPVLIQPAGENWFAGKLRAFLARMMKTACVISSAAWALPALRKAVWNITRFTCARYQRGERRLGMVPRVLCQQFNVIQLRHLPINVRPGEKGNRILMGNITNNKSNIPMISQSPAKWRLVGCSMFDV